MLKTKKTVVVAVLLLLMFLLGSITGWWAFANPGSPVWVLEQNSMSACASYIIGRRNATISYVRDGETGEIIHTNTSDIGTFAYARNAAYDDGGGLVFVRAGTYDFGDTSLGARNRVSWKGEGSATIITSNNMFFYVCNNSVVSNMHFNNVKVTASNSVNTTITHCIIEKSLMGFYTGSNSTVTNNLFAETTYAAVQISHSHAIINDNVFLDCDSTANENYAPISLYSTHQVNNVVVSDNIIIGGADAGILLVTKGYSIQNCLITDNIIDNTGEEGVLVWADVTGNIENVTISGNHISEVGTYGIELKTDASLLNVTDIVIDDNHFSNCPSGSLTITKYVGTTITFTLENNKGLVSENQDLATIANDEYVAHGIDSILNINQSNSTVLVTAYTTVYDSVPVVVGCKAVNVTHIQVSAYWTNGTAITTDAIQVWWNVKYSP